MCLCQVRLQNMAADTLQPLRMLPNQLPAAAHFLRQPKLPEPSRTQAVPGGPGSVSQTQLLSPDCQESKRSINSWGMKQRQESPAHLSPDRSAPCSSFTQSQLMGSHQNSLKKWKPAEDKSLVLRPPHLNPHVLCLPLTAIREVLLNLLKGSCSTFALNWKVIEHCLSLIPYHHTNRAPI